MSSFLEHEDLEYRGRALLSAEQRVRIQRRLTAHAERIEEGTLVLLISPLLGWGLLEFKKALHPSCPVVCVEFDSELLAYCRQRESKAPDCLSDETAVAIECKKFIEEFSVKQCYTVFYTDYAYAFQRKVQDIVGQCKESIVQHWSNQATLGKMGGLWLRNIWSNAARKKIASFSLLSNAYRRKSGTDTAAVVVGAGPSLDTRLLEFLQKEQKKLRIISVDTALPVLQKHGIVPDFCVILEGQWYNIFDFLPPPAAETHAIADISAFPASLRGFSHACFVSTEFAKLSFFLHYAKQLPYRVPAMGSVGLLSIYLAHLLPVSELFLIGMDFSFYIGQSHAGHSAAYNKWLNTGSRTVARNMQNLSSGDLRNISTVSRRYTDAMLSRYLRNLQTLLTSLKKKHSIPIFDLNRESCIAAVPVMDIGSCQKRLAGRGSKPSFTQLMQEAGQDYSFDSLRFLESEQLKYRGLQERVEILQRKKEIPGAKDWQDGLDMCTFTLMADKYKICNDRQYWQKARLYTRMQVCIHRALRDIEKNISIAKVLGRAEQKL